ncbi:MAG: DUF357 domain-containing protein [Candidatus Aenigmatarchaeota archaeon]
MIKDKISKEEIEKWSNKLESTLNKTRLKDNTKEDFLKNIIAYVNDCKYWIKQGDYVKAWEVISFAWGLYEAGEELGVF